MAILKLPHGKLCEIPKGYHIVDPFYGAGGLSIDFISKNKVFGYLSDYNPSVIHFHETLRDFPTQLIECIQELSFTHKNSRERKALYLYRRNMYNEIVDSNTPPWVKAGLMWYVYELSKNYVRYNHSGKINSSYYPYIDITIDPDEFYRASKTLHNYCELRCCYYDEAIIPPNSIVIIDLPGKNQRYGSDFHFDVERYIRWLQKLNDNKIPFITT